MQSLYIEVIVLQACNPTWQATVGNCTKLQLSTPWSCNVDPANPWPEYPRPQLARSNPEQWKNLNGVWEYRNSTKKEYDGLSGLSVGGELEGGQAVLVPFCLESALSGM